MSRLNRPGWVTAVAVLMIVFSGLGILGKIYVLIMNEVMRSMTSSFAHLNEFDGFSESPMDSYPYHLILLAGIIAVLILTTSIIFGARMLKPNKIAPDHAKFILVINIGFRVLFILALFGFYEDAMKFQTPYVFTSGIAIIIDLTLLLIVVNSNKSFYQGQKTQDDLILDDFEELADL